MISPRQAFQKSVHFKEFSNIIESEAHRQALFSALLQMQMNSPETTDPTLSGIYDQRLVGARQFISVLSRLCDTDIPTNPPQSFGNLNHQV